MGKVSGKSKCEEQAESRNPVTELTTAHQSSKARSKTNMNLFFFRVMGRMAHSCSQNCIKNLVIAICVEAAFSGRGVLLKFSLIFRARVKSETGVALC